MRYMGLDLGTKTLGISLSNGIIASVYGTLRHDEEYDRIANEVAILANEKKVDIIVLGFPKNMNNTIGERAEITLEFKKKLEELTKLPVELEDERLTSKVANDVLISADTSRKKRKERVDGMASVIILQSYLDRKEN
ncbi:MAG: Holliday junction resolvase RuvX [Bacilli bacterium]|nr:Holliday junction resolvase RuvX [Bacilli bacterium]